jgi:hypothetical protein
MTDKDFAALRAREKLEEQSMTDVIQAPGMGHNQPDPLEMEKKNQKWDRWAKKRTFVRALEGTYSHLYKTLKEEKRVYSAQDVAWKGGPQMFGKSVISPQATSIIQSIESHIEAYAPKHFNDSDKEECIHLVFKAKPLFLFMHLLLQKMVEWPPDLDPALGPYSPPKDL